MAGSSLPDHEAVHTALGGVLDELVAGRVGPGGEVGHRAGVGGQHLDQLAGCQLLDRDRGLDDRQWARQAFEVEGGGGGGGGDRGAHAGLISESWVAARRSGMRPWGTVSQYRRLNAHLAACQKRDGAGGTGGCW